MKYVIFSIDNPKNSVYLTQAFNAAINRSIAPNKMKPLIGCYKGYVEQSWIMQRSDFDEHVAHHGFMDGQESILCVSECNKQYAVLQYNDGRPDEFLGSMHEVPEEEARMSDGWTYDPSRNIYWVAKQGNPDRMIHD